MFWIGRLRGACSEASLGEQFLRISKNYLSWINRILSFLISEKILCFSDILFKEYYNLFVSKYY